MAVVKFSGKPIEKLIDTVSKGIGILYEPKRIRKKADAEAYRLEKLEEAKAKGLILKSDAEFEIIERARERFAHREINRQINLESIVEKSTKHLGETVSEEPVDEDWRTRFFSKAQDVTNEEMQEVWGKILAEEVTKPGKISFRTLEVISNLSKNEAHLFELACKIALNDGRILKMSSDNAFDNYGINYTSLLKLRAAGLIYDSDTLNVTYGYIEHLSGVIINFGSKVILCNKENTKEYKFDQVLFTPSGTELMQTINTDKNYEYINKFIEAKQKEQFVFKILN
ncbi:hypothetical protein BZG02_16020 [Labilibaculum filiforme]|uniref:DUF2806 domain-containing protein n=1 Tax=Labilibaculum filiforme TaxID=1940526 RepID=A0A2N3HTD9_9BACT|nr:DUF2806 domain-containing protein [Labilibaculum filiforme]PKQ61301.1 hypothetical protein BZG02_16020 [Labilibaculum filiforme]